MKKFITRKIKILLLSSILLLSGIPQYCGATPPAIHAVKTGNWSDNTVWSGSAVPTSANTVTIGGSYTVTVNGTDVCSSLTLGDGTNSGSLGFNSGTSLTVSGNLHIGNSPTVGNIDMTNGGILSIGSAGISDAGTWTPGTGTVIIASATTLPTLFFRTFNNLTISASGIVYQGWGLTITNSLTIGSGSTFNLNSSNCISGDLQGSGTLTNNTGTTTLTTGSDNSNTTFSGVIKNNPGVVGLIKTGTGTLTLSGANSYSGGTTLNEGQININNATALGTGTFTIAAGTTIDNTSGSAIALADDNAQTWNGSFTFTGSNALNMSTGAVTLGTSPTVTINGSTLTIGGTINDNVNSLTTAGSGTFSLGNQAMQLNNLTPGAGTFISTSGDLSLDGNLSNNGTFTNNGGTVTFDGTTGQTISTGSNPLTFTNLSINDASGITLNSPLSVSGTLTLNNGIINANTSSDIVTLSSTASCPAGGSTYSYVNGVMAKTGNSAFVFPIGNSTRFMPIGISAPATSTNTITAEYEFALPVNSTTLNSPLVTVSSLEYWYLTESVSTDAIYLTLNWESSPMSGIYTYDTTLRVAQYSGGAWNDLGNSAVSGTFPGAGSVSASTSVSAIGGEFTFGSTDNNSNPLPITLSSFNANYIEESNTVQVNWTVATQLNNKAFVIEKTQDGINYTEVGTLSGAGTTPFAQSYSMVDYSPLPGVSYYRLRQIDIDNYSTLFSPVPVYDGNITNNTVTVYPNPVAEYANINYISENSLPVTVTIFDLGGRAVSTKEYTQVNTGENTLSLNTSGLSQGIYLLQITNAQKSFYQKIVKQ